MRATSIVRRDAAPRTRDDLHPGICPDLKGARHAFAEVAGVRIHYVEAGQGEPLVLLHGWPQHWWSFRAVIPALATRYRVIVPDLRGLGWSEGSPGGYHFLGMAANLIGLLDALAIPRVRLVGHDWGAAIGYTTCLQWPLRVERFVALGAVTPWSLAAPWSAPDALWRLALRAWHVFALALLGRFALRQLTPPQRALRVWRHVGRFTPEEQEIYLRPLRTRAAEYATLRWYESAVFRELPYYRKHHRSVRLSTPTLHLNGACDPLTQGIPDGFHHANAPQLRFALIPDCGHFIAEERPEELLARLTTFFASASA